MDSNVIPHTRRLTRHRSNALNDQIEVLVVDQPGQGNANHHYEIHLPDTIVDGPGQGHTTGPACTIKFQNGPVNEIGGVNGISAEALLAVVIDRLESFQAGPYSCRENACAKTHLEEALMWLGERTRQRIQRGVEGTHAK